MGAQGPAEYVVKLGTSIDNKGLNQIIDFFDTFRKSGLGIAAAVTGATTALYKFIESTTKQEFELRKLAKAQGKTVEEMTKQDAVLKAMGKSLEEVRKDDKLKKTYEEIMKFNKELELPNASGSIKKIEELRSGFWKLKSIIGIAVSSIGKQLLINLEEPIKRITGAMGSISDWVRTNLNSISHKVSSVLTAFAKGIIAIGEVVGKIFGWIRGLPAGIKAIAAAIGALGLALSTGPIGQILMAISLIGDLMHDYDNYKWNQKNAQDTEFWAADNEQGWTRDKSKAKVDPATGKPMAYQAKIGLEEAWAGYDQEGIMGVGKALGNKLVEGLNSFDTEGAGASLGDFIVNLLDQLTKTVSGEGADTAVGSITKAAVTFGQKLLGFIGGLFSKIAPTGAEIGEFVNGLFTGIGKFLSGGAGGAFTLPTEAFKAVSDVANGILDFILKGFEGLTEKDKEGNTGFDNFIKGMFDFLGKAVEDFASRISKGEIDPADTIATIGTKIGDIIGGAIQISMDALDRFLSEASKWVVEHKDELIRIGMAILQGIVDGLFNIKDAIMRKLFGDWWVGNTERRDTQGQVKGKFIDPVTGEVHDTVVGESGKEYRLDEGDEFSRTNVRAAQVEFGIRQATGFEAYKRAFYKALGDEELSRRLGYGDENTTLASSIARLFGANYDPTTMTFSGKREKVKVGGKWVDGDFKNTPMSSEQNANLMSLIGELSFADTEESFKQVFGDIQKIMGENGLETKVDISNAEQEAEAARQKMEETFAEPITVKVKTEEGSAEGRTQQALGGRFASRANITIGEDGTEYAIPITKPERATSLLKQMFGEMGGAAVSRISKDLGLGIPGTNGAGMGSMSSAMSGMKMANSYSINAPVTIIVNSDADAREVGSRVYDLAERHLIKNLVGVNG